MSESFIAREERRNWRAARWSAALTVVFVVAAFQFEAYPLVFFGAASLGATIAALMCALACRRIQSR